MATFGMACAETPASAVRTARRLWRSLRDLHCGERTVFHVSGFPTGAIVLLQLVDGLTKALDGPKRPPMLSWEAGVLPAKRSDFPRARTSWTPRSGAAGEIVLLPAARRGPGLGWGMVMEGCG